jgi:putative Holliday junction resolvase
VSRLLGVDLGGRRIGLAVAATDAGTARGLATIMRGTLDDDAAALAHVVAEQRIDELVVGLPLLPSGDEGDQAMAARAWADEIGRRLGRPVSMQDERFTSRAAEVTVGPARRRHDGGPPGQAARSGQRAAVDREAARRILQAALGARAGVPS